MAKTNSTKYYEGVGSRKNARARVRIYEGKGASIVNDIPFEDAYPDKTQRSEMTQALVTSGVADKFYFSAKTYGGGTTGQADAIKLGIARAIVAWDETKQPELSKTGLLTRDPRKKERKKYFLLKARKKGQFSKR